MMEDQKETNFKILNNVLDMVIRNLNIGLWE